MVSSFKQIVRKTGLFAPPPEAAEGGFDDFRPVSGWKPLIHLEPGNRTTWINEDLAPTPIQMRVWTHWSFMALWLTENFGAGSWSSGASLISIGLTVPQALGVCAVGTFMCTLIAVAAARVGSVYHVGFPTWCRTVYGMWGSKIMVTFRGIVAIIWYAVQTFYGAQMLDVTLRAIFGNSWQNIPNHLPASSGTTTRAMAAYFLMWLLQVPFLFIHPATTKHVFAVKCWFLPAASMGFLGGIIKLAGGSIDFTAINSKSPVSGAAASWAWLQGINAIFGTISPMLINQPDIGRYSATPGAALWPQAIYLSTGKFFCFFLGIVSASAYKQISGTLTWNVWSICGGILDRQWTPGWRAGLAIFGLIQCFGTIGTNLFANTIPFAADMSGVAPKQLNIIRGQLICVILSWAVCPWLILTSGAKFVTFLGSYTVFMAALMGILLADFYIIRRGNLHVPSMFDAVGDVPNPKGLYYLGPKSFNLKAFAAWIIGIGPVVPGLAYSYTTKTDAAAIAFKRIYNTGFLVSFFLAGISYLIMMKIWPAQVYPEGHEDAPLTYEYLKPTHGYFPGEPEILYGRGVMKGDEASELEEGHSQSEDEKINEKDSGMVGVRVIPALAQ